MPHACMHACTGHYGRINETRPDGHGAATSATSAGARAAAASQPCDVHGVAEVGPVRPPRSACNACRYVGTVASRRPTCRERDGGRRGVLGRHLVGRPECYPIGHAHQERDSQEGLL